MAEPWPATLPALNELHDYGESPADNLLRSGMAVGPDKVRRRTTSGIRPISGWLLLTLAQVDILDVFYESTLANGSISVTSTHPRTSTAIEFRFVSPPAYQKHRGMWRATLDLEVLP